MSEADDHLCEADVAPDDDVGGAAVAEDTEDEPTPDEIAIQRGDACLEAEDFHGALAAYDEALTHNPSNPEALYGRGAALHGLGEYHRVIEEMTRAVELAPNEPRIFMWRAKAHAALDENNPALSEDIKVMIPLFFKELIKVFDSGGDREWVASQCSYILLFRPNHHGALAHRGACRYVLEDHDAAYDDLKRAVELQPKWWFSQFCFGRVQEWFGDYDAALDAYTAAIELDPDGQEQFEYHGASQYICRGKAWLAVDEPQRALDDFNAAIALAPDDVAYHLRSRAWLALGEIESAEADLTQAIALDPQAPVHFEARANVRAMLGDFDASYEDHEHASQLEERQDLDQTDDNEAGMSTTAEDRLLIYNQIQEHFGQAPLESIEVTERNFHARVAADLQMALNELAASGVEVLHFYSIHRFGSPVCNFTQLYERDRRNPPTAVPHEYVEIDVGAESPVRCLKFGVWLLRSGDVSFLVMLDTVRRHQQVNIQAAVLKGTEGHAAVIGFFKHLEDSVKRAACYRGKVLSLEYQDSYNGQAVGLRVHKLRPVEREQVILPQATLELLERNVVQFVQQRPRLKQMGLATKKGLLFYGPPGTGKTHTIHYLAQSVPNQTTFLISAEQVNFLSDYMTLARLMQPSLIVIEDVDLIARDRNSMHSAGEELLLNKLLNEMDGLRAEADVLFVLTTNRPETLEAALAARPGRIDQAIEFPYPDAIGRAKLVKLYAQGMDVSDEAAELVVRRTENVAASFIKELMRRAAQFYLERSGEGPLEVGDVEGALDEMLVRGGLLNRSLLGAASHVAASNGD